MLSAILPRAMWPVLPSSFARIGGSFNRTLVLKIISNLTLHELTEASNKGAVLKGETGNPCWKDVGVPGKLVLL